MMSEVRRYWLALLLLACAWLAPAIVFDQLPDRIVTHWNAAGVPDGWSTKTVGAFFGPGLATLLAIALVAAPRMSPQGFGMERIARIYPILVAAIVGLLLYVSVGMLRVALGATVDVRAHVLAGTGLIVVLIGNYLGKTTRNFFFGIRTPWTLANDDVWERTHRMAGPVFVACGMALFAAGFAPPGAAVALVVLAALTMGVVPIVYSYVVSRRLARAPTP